MKIPFIALILITLLLLNCAQERLKEIPESECAGCHEEVVIRWNTQTSSHSLLFRCDFCHEQKINEGKEGHMSSIECNECHTEVMHFPLISLTRSQCGVCHEPHGSSNIYLIKEYIEFDKNPETPVKFYNVQGKEDYSFAEASKMEGGENELEPGSGICEVCHTSTVYYNSSGNGASHLTESCIDCHKHSLGFYAGEK